MTITGCDPNITKCIRTSPNITEIVNITTLPNITVQMVTAFVEYRLAADVSVACEPIVLMIACFFLGFELALGCLWTGVGL